MHGTPSTTTRAIEKADCHASTNTSGLFHRSPSRNQFAQSVFSGSAAARTLPFRKSRRPLRHAEMQVGIARRQNIVAGVEFPRDGFFAGPSRGQVVIRAQVRLRDHK
jgi:hypothetical protein